MEIEHDAAAVLAAAFRASADATLLLRGDDERVIEVNDVWCATTGRAYADAVGRPLRTLGLWGDALQADVFLEALRAHGELRDWEAVFVRRLADGREVEGRVSLTAQTVVLGRTAYFLIVGRDITASWQAAQRAQQTRRLEDLGRLAGGVAHDFNNLLTVIRAGTESALAAIESGERPDPAELQEVLAVTARATDLTRQLLTFGRQRVAQPGPIDLSALVVRTTPLLRRALGPDVHLDQHVAPGLPAILAEPSQVEQVLLNLLVNARDAMPTGGRVRLRTALSDVGEAGERVLASSREPAPAGARPTRHPGRGEARGTWGAAYAVHPAAPEGAAAGAALDDDLLDVLPPGRYVVLEVADTGTGMDAATRARIFEPFFTTKSPERGTGLGLAVVYGAVRQAGGSVAVTSAPGAGTRFRVFWPTVPTVPTSSIRPTAPD